MYIEWLVAWHCVAACLLLTVCRQINNNTRLGHHIKYSFGFVLGITRLLCSMSRPLYRFNQRILGTSRLWTRPIEFWPQRMTTTTEKRNTQRTTHQSYLHIWFRKIGERNNKHKTHATWVQCHIHSTEEVWKMNGVWDTWILHTG